MHISEMWHVFQWMLARILLVIFSVLVGHLHLLANSTFFVPRQGEQYNLHHEIASTERKKIKSQVERGMDVMKMGKINCF